MDEMLNAALRAAFDKAFADVNNHLEDIIAGLLINGVAYSEIRLERHVSDGSTVVVVRGVPRYKVELTTDEMCANAAP
jgi:hypothetical protein